MTVYKLSRRAPPSAIISVAWNLVNGACSALAFMAADADISVPNAITVRRKIAVKPQIMMEARMALRIVGGIITARIELY